MKKKKLNLGKLKLNKEKVITLTSDEVIKINGGGQVSRDSCHAVCNGTLNPTEASVWCNPKPGW